MISLKYKIEFENIIETKLREDSLRMLFTINDEENLFRNSFDNFRNELFSNLYLIPLKESVSLYINSHFKFLVNFYNKISFFEGLFEDEEIKLVEKFKLPKQYRMGQIPSIFFQYFELMKDVCLSYNIDFEAQCKKYNKDEILKHFYADFKFNEYAKVDFIEDYKYLDIEFSEDKSKIIMLHELGVIDFLRRQLDNVSNNKLGEILKPITEVKPDTIARYLSRIAKSEISLDSPEVINTLNRLKIKINKVK